MQGFQPNAIFAVFSLPLPTFFLTMDISVKTDLLLMGSSFLDVYSPATVTIPWFINDGVLKIRNSFYFTSQLILSWRVIMKDSSRLFYAFPEKLPFHFSPLVIHFFPYSILCYNLASILLKCSISRLHSCPHSPLSRHPSHTCLQEKRLKSSTKNGASTLIQDVFFPGCSHLGFFVCLFAYLVGWIRFYCSCPLEISLKKIKGHPSISLPLHFPPLFIQYHLSELCHPQEPHAQ